MKGLKFLASCAVVSAVAAACATASFAADYTATASYDNGTVTVGIPADYVAATDGDLTLLILSEDATSITEANKSIVKQIQQGDATALSSVAVGDLADGTYFVRIGGAEVGTDNPNGFIATTFTVGSTNPENPYANSDRILGDVTADATVDLRDVTPLVYHSIGLQALEGESLQAADVTDDATVDLRDVTPVVYKAIGVDSTVDGVKTIAEKANYVEE